MPSPCHSYIYFKPFKRRIDRAQTSKAAPKFCTSVGTTTSLSHPKSGVFF
jgi:hypothetical protein